MFKSHLIALFATFSVLLSTVHAQFGTPKTQAAIIPEFSTVTPGQTVAIAMKLTHDDHWHSYFANAGIEYFITPTLTFDTPEGLETSELQFPTPIELKTPAATLYAYEGTNYFLSSVKVPATLQSGDSFTFTATAGWQVCDDNSCLPPNSKEITLNLSVAQKAKANPSFSEVAKYSSKHIPSKLLPDDWKLSASEKAGIITLTIVGRLPEDLTFFEYDGQIDVQKDRTLSIDKNTHSFVGTRNTAGKNLPRLRGIIHTPSDVIGSKNKAFWIDVPFEGADATAVIEATPVKKIDTAVIHSVDKFTEEEIKEMAKLYDVSAPIDFVTIDQIDDEGNLLSREVKDNGLLTFLAFAFIGGMILNLMPCIFPVLGVKILGFAQLSGNDPKKIKLHGVAFAAGMVISMWILAGILLAVKASTGTISWGQQMGDPYFVGIMIIILVLFGLNLYGMFEVGTSLTGAGSNLQSKKGYQGSFFSGVMTTLIATPCSGPFLGATMGFALQQNAFVTMVIFTVFALGIASPYIVLSFAPALINKLPRPGGWMVTFKKIMAFPMLATAAFLMQAFGKQTGSAGLSWLAMGLVVIALAAFIYGQWSPPYIAKGKRYGVGWGLATVIAAAGIWISYDAMSQKGESVDSSDEWATWHPGIVPHTRAKGRIVWMDYTADY